MAAPGSPCPNDNSPCPLECRLLCLLCLGGSLGGAVAAGQEDRRGLTPAAAGCFPCMSAAATAVNGAATSAWAAAAACDGNSYEFHVDALQVRSCNEAASGTAHLG